MSAVLNMLGSMEMHLQYFDEPESAPLHERFAAVGLVVLLHLSAFMAYWAQPEMPRIIVSEMSVSFANMQMQRADVVPQAEPQPKQQPKPRKIEPEPIPADEPVVTEEAPPVTRDTSPMAQNALPSSTMPQDGSPPSPVVLDAEPDYRAEYLNNPRPPYPMVARRMGYHGKVVLNVEVLAEGKAGQVLLHQSSGYEILDNAALQTVKSWRFSPARRFGQPITLWFLVPIKFFLEDN